MANLKISFPGLNYSAYSIVNNRPAYEGTSVYNLGTGERYTRYRTDTNYTTATIELSNFVNIAPDHVIMARADLCAANCTTFRIDRGAGFATVWTDASFASATLKGPRSQDYLATFSLSAESIWRLAYVGSSGRFMHSKVYLGEWFEMNCELDDYTITRELGDGEPFYSGDRTAHFARTTEPRYEGTLSWRGVTDAKVAELVSILADPDKHYCFLYTSAVTEVLDDVELLHVKLTSFDWQRIHSDWNLVNLAYEELIG